MVTGMQEGKCRKVKEYEVTPEEIVMEALCNASASGMTLTDCLRLMEHAHCLGCWSEAINLYGMEGIDTKRHRFVYSGTATEFFALGKK